MPELPEIEILKKSLNKNIKSKFRTGLILEQIITVKNHRNVSVLWAVFVGRTDNLDDVNGASGITQIDDIDLCFVRKRCRNTHHCSRKLVLAYKKVLICSQQLVCLNINFDAAADLNVRFCNEIIRQ